MANIRLLFYKFEAATNQKREAVAQVIGQAMKRLEKS
jgi:hypothetical protein